MSIIQHNYSCPTGSLAHSKFSLTSYAPLSTQCAPYKKLIRGTGHSR